MFSRSRKKIILAIMGSLALLFAATLSVILLASYREVRQNQSEMLERYVSLYTPELQPGGQAAEPPERQDIVQPGTEEPSGDEPLPGAEEDQDAGRKPERLLLDDRPDYQLSTFYSVTFSKDGDVLLVDNGEIEIYSEEELTEIARKMLEGGRASGTYGSLSYMVRDKGGYTLVAILDNTVTQSGMNTLLRYVLIVGCAAMVVLFFISQILSKWIIRPLEENDRKQKQFVSDAGHELKTPVAVIGANSELLLREIGENEWLANIRYENERMGSLVKQLLDLSRAENAEVVKEEVDLSRIVTGEALAFESLAYDQGKMLQSEIEEGIRIMGNQIQLEQLVSILLDNAIRHSTGEEIGISLKRKQHLAILSVTNQGEEIPKEKQEHLFDRFYRIDEARNSEDQHYGLGLSIARAIVRGHRGTIRVSCQDGSVKFEASVPVK